MRRLPIIPTIIVAAAVAVMIGLGIWQLQRAGWKDRLLAELAAAEGMPAVDLDPLLSRGGETAPAVAFRRALVTCDGAEAAPELRAGRNLRGDTGYSAFLPCRRDGEGWGRRLQVNVGWTARPERDLRVSLGGIVAGRVGTVEPEGPIILTAATASAGLVPSAPPSIDEVPNNHLAYAFQWFFFAATAGLIYFLALRRRRRPVAPPPREP